MSDIVRKGRLVELKGGRKVWVKPLPVIEENDCVNEARGSVVSFTELIVRKSVRAHEGLIERVPNADETELVDKAMAADLLPVQHPVLGAIMPRSIINALDGEDCNAIVKVARPTLKEDEPGK